MDKQQTFLLNEAADSIQSITDDLYGKLSGQPFSMEYLADALGQHLPNFSRKQVSSTIQLLNAGIQAGKEEFERLYRLPTAALDGEIARQLDQYLEPLPEARQRQFLLLLFQVLYQDTGLKIGSNLSIYMANMPLDMMKRDVCALLEEKGKEIVGDISTLLPETAEKLKQHGENPKVNEFTDEQRDLITAAAVYAAMQKTELKVVGPEQIGKQISIQKTFLQRLGEAMRDKVLPVALRVLAIAAVAVALYGLIEFLLYSEALAFVTSYISANHMWKIALPAAFTVAAAGCSWLHTNLLTDPIIYRGQSDAVDARSELQRHYDQATLQADQFVENLNSEYMLVEDDSSEDYTMDDGDIEETPDIVI